MKYTRQIMAAALLLAATGVEAQTTVWSIDAADTSRFRTYKSYEGVDSITTRSNRLVLWSGGKTKANVPYGNLGEGKQYLTTQRPGRTLYCPSDFKNMDWYSDDSEYCLQRSRESDHFIVFWHKQFGNDPTQADGSYAFDPQTLLDAAEKIYDVNTGRLGFAKPGSSPTLDNYKQMLFVRYQNEWLATGSGYDNKVGAFWCNPAAVNSFSTVGHEIGHMFQYIIYCDLGGGHGWRGGLGPNAAGGNMFWESCAQWQSFQVYPEGTFSGWYSSYPSYAHMNQFHEDPRYANYFFQYYWCQLHGQDFIGRLWRETLSPEDVVDTYKRVTGASQATYCDEMFDYARRAVTWDIDGLRELGRNRRDAFSTPSYHEAGDGWLQVDSSRCVQNYGFNVYRMDVPADGTTVTLDFKGMAGAQGYRSVESGKAGWRYGFVALTADGERVYGETGRDSIGQLSFVTPQGTKNLWLVVSGAPTTHFHHEWDDNVANDEQWPYAFRCEGSDVQGHVSFDPNATPQDTTVTLHVTAPKTADDVVSGVHTLNLTPICQALVVEPEQLMLKRANAGSDSIKVYAVLPDGTLSEDYGNKYSFLFYFDEDGQVLKADGDTNLQDKAAYYSIVQTYSKEVYLYYGELKEMLQPGDSHTFGIAFQRTLKDGRKVTARVNLVVDVVD